MMRRKLCILIALAGVGFSVAMVVGCDRAPAPSDGNAARPTVVSLAPNVTELLFALGLGRHVIGRSSFCRYPSEVEPLPILGDAREVNFEKMLAMAPDLAIFNTANAATFTRLTDAGIRVLSPRMETVDEVYQVIGVLGREFHVEDQAAALAERLRGELAAVRRAADGARPVRTLVTFPGSIGTGGELLVVGRETFLDETLTLAGGRNVAEASGYPRINIETIVRWAPEVVIISETGDFSPGLSDEEYRRQWAAWQTIPAVRDGRIVVLREPYLTIPGARMGAAARLLLKTLHPDRAIVEQKQRAM
jgi:iron complex transport system substrate-binding protein